jgi:hypothetical protein
LKFEVNLDERTEVKVLNNKESFYNTIKKQLRLIFILQLITANYGWQGLGNKFP